MQRVHLHSHNHLRYKLVWLFPMALPESLQLSESNCQEQCTQKSCTFPLAGSEAALSSSQKRVSMISSHSTKAVIRDSFVIAVHRRASKSYLRREYVHQFRIVIYGLTYFSFKAKCTA